jgi:HEAT repeat protein
VLGQLGDLAGAPLLVKNLTRLLEDSDPYAREAAVRTLGQIGAPAATPDVIAALTKAAQEGEINIHEAAIDSLSKLRDLRPLNSLQQAVGSS